MKALEILGRLADQEYQRKYPATPLEYMTPHRFHDRNSNALTRSIIKFIQIKGGQAERVACTGRPVNHSKVVTDRNSRHFSDIQGLYP